jgi:hypothetical protein
MTSKKRRLAAALFLIHLIVPKGCSTAVLTGISRKGIKAVFNGTDQ